MKNTSLYIVFYDFCLIVNIVFWNKYQILIYAIIDFIKALEASYQFSHHVLCQHVLTLVPLSFDKFMYLYTV